MPIVLKPGSLILLVPSGLVQGCNRIALPFITKQSNICTYFVQTPISSNPFTIHKKNNLIPWKSRILQNHPSPTATLANSNTQRFGDRLRFQPQGTEKFEDTTRMATKSSSETLVFELHCAVVGHKRIL